MITAGLAKECSDSKSTAKNTGNKPKETPALVLTATPEPPLRLKLVTPTQSCPPCLPLVLAQETPSCPPCPCQCWSVYSQQYWLCGEGGDFTCVRNTDCCGGHWVRSTPEANR